jgi:hypothetical protein
VRQDSFIKEKMKPWKRFIVKGTGSHLFCLVCGTYQLGKLDNEILHHITDFPKKTNIIQEITKQ